MKYVDPNSSLGILDADVAVAFGGFCKMAFTNASGFRGWVLEAPGSLSLWDGVLAEELQYSLATNDTKPFADALRDVPRYSSRISDSAELITILNKDSNLFIQIYSSHVIISDLRDGKTYREDYANGDFHWCRALCVAALKYHETQTCNPE